ncbi:MAG: hypothetical protein ACHQ1H_08660 [Nitrososphaerales archaeon]
MANIATGLDSSRMITASTKFTLNSDEKPLMWEQDATGVARYILFKTFKLPLITDLISFLILSN